MQGLPSHRRLLDALAAALSSRANHPCGSSPPSGPDDPGAARRWLLLTLHVLFPDVVLPALDLLDRRLVSRVSMAAEETGPPAGRNRDGSESSTGVRDCRRDSYACEPDNHGTLALDTVEHPASRRLLTCPSRCPHLYVVQSLASTMGRPRGGREGASPPKIHVVHLDAWSCSCANFALAAFGSQSEAEMSLFKPRTSSSPRPAPLSPTSEDLPSLGGQGVGCETTSFFGGMSIDRRSSRGENMPCCKHLLACVLAEVWSGVNDLIDDRTVSKYELAGIAAGVF
ncbi:hypothetical protein HIM_08588 [Hirsutella minnesotensis 3608]|uniref:SWIM-type domain-containing protein n=1 Tax=Hirsutella minnesotensis 3608 TaxID=1043627 RepID=A0A0F7ZY84_9HYPO|nr:hypothetical protein HIM_08588 [Hirsutella minnesotensis 3608]